MSTAAKFRFVQCLPWVAAWSPVALFVVVLNMAAHIRLGLGHWPTPMLEDYDSLLFQAHEMFYVVVYLFSILLAGPLWLLCVLVPALRPPVRDRWWQPMIYGLGWGMIFLAAYLDPTTFTAWLLD